MAPAAKSALWLASHIDDRCTKPTASAKLDWCVRKSQTACPWLITYSWLGTGTPSRFNASMNALSTMSSGRAGAFGGAGLGRALDGGTTVGCAAGGGGWRADITTNTVATAPRDSGNAARGPKRRSTALRR